jgi:hypothetical protein
MNDARLALRSLTTYAICIVLAMVLGYLLANPIDAATMTVIGIVLAVIATPIMLRYHYPAMLFVWNTSMIAFFLPGKPSLWLFMIAIGFFISFTHRILDKKVQFLSVPELTRPLLAMIVVVLVTAELRGGIGLSSFGGGSVGGRRYIQLLVAILGYFALTARRIPPEKATLYAGMFLLGGAISLVGDLFSLLPSAFHFIFYLIPPNFISADGFELGVTRLPGASTLGASATTYLLMRHGVRNMLAPGRKHLLVLFGVALIIGLYGGYRSMLIYVVIVFAVQFFLEGMHRTQWVVFFSLALLLSAAVALPFLQKLPMNIQRTLAFLPLDISHEARHSAEESSEWRLEMWRAAVPLIPQYLLLGKGFSFTKAELEYMRDPTFSRQEFSIAERGSMIAGDYHSGPLSLIIPFGIWGVFVFVWFIWAAIGVLRKNRRYGDPALQMINTLLLATFIARLFMFLFVVGGFYGDMLFFGGIVGLSVAINGGVARPATELAASKPVPLGRPPKAPLPQPGLAAKVQQGSAKGT